VSAFPTLSKNQDSSYFKETANDPAIRKKVESGYTVSRSRYTRKPARSFQTGFTMIDEADKALLQTFWGTVSGGSVAFDWTHPVTAEIITVRFAKAFSYKYAGAGNNNRWNVTDIALEEV
jgi:hypothetical protein